MSSFFINACIVNAETKEELEKKEEVNNNKINISRSSYNYTSLGTALPGAIFYTPGAADWARELALLSRPYNDAFWANKSCETTDNYNCSQLVWCAYNAITTINLDYNGGFGVYPNDIISSNNLTYATTY